MRYARICCIAALGLALSSVAHASTFGCESVAGSVIFKDTMYGVLTGSVLSGLYILAQDKENRSNTEQTLSRGAAIGGLLGFGLGITEISLRECPGVRVTTKKLSTSVAAWPEAGAGMGAAWRMSWQF